MKIYENIADSNSKSVKSWSAFFVHFKICNISPVDANDRKLKFWICYPLKMIFMKIST